ncbi:MAG: hypothetical protein V4591_05755 [Bdellovibrionota bacterium]
MKVFSVVISFLCLQSIFYGCSYMHSGSIKATSPHQQDLAPSENVQPADDETSSEKQFNTFSLSGSETNSTFTATGTIDQTAQTIIVNVPFDTKDELLANLVATFDIIGDHVEVDGVEQNATTGHDFTNNNKVIYSVVAENGSKINYSVTVNRLPSTVKDFLTFSLRADNVPDGDGAKTEIHYVTIRSTAVNIDNVNNTIEVTFPSSIRADLIAEFSTNSSVENPVKIGDVSQINGSTQNDYSNPVAFTIKAGDGSTRNYTVTVKTPPPPPSPKKK